MQNNRNCHNLSTHDSYLVAERVNLTPGWVSGIIDSEGNFSILVQQTKGGCKIGLAFKVTQKGHSKGILLALQRYFGCGNIYIDNKKEDAYKFSVNKIDDIVNNVIPLLEKYSLLTSKNLDYLDFKKVALLMKDKQHLNPKVKEEIVLIKNNMNSLRSFEERWNYLKNSEPIKLSSEWVQAFVDGEGSFLVQKTKVPPLTLGTSLVGKRFYSTKKDNTKSFKPEVIYSNADTQKELIFRDNNGKSGVYRWINNINGKTYVGSSINLSHRFYQYYSLRIMEYTLQKSQSHIFKALIKYGYSSFSLEILEYCEPSKVIEREQFYLDLLSPIYNILKIAGSRLGYITSDKTKELLRLANLGENHPLYGKTHSEDTKALMRLAHLAENNSMYGKKHSEETKALMSAAQKLRDKSGFEKTAEHRSKLSKSLGHKIEITDVEANVSGIFDTVGEAAKYLNSSPTSVSRYIKNKTLFKGKYRIDKLNNSK